MSVEAVGEMRLLLAIALILLFLWLRKAQTSDDVLDGNPCEAPSVSEAAASLLLSPLSLYSWLASTLVRLVLSAPALVLRSLHHSVLLLLAGPWCVAAFCLSLVLTCLHVALYLLHLALVVAAAAAAAAVLTLARHKMADGAIVKAPNQQKKVERTGLRMFGRRVTLQG